MQFNNFVFSQQFVIKLSIFESDDSLPFFNLHSKISNVHLEIVINFFRRVLSQGTFDQNRFIGSSCLLALHIYYNTYIMFTPLNKLVFSRGNISQESQNLENNHFFSKIISEEKHSKIRQVFNCDKSNTFADYLDLIKQYNLSFIITVGHNVSPEVNNKVTINSEQNGHKKQGINEIQLQVNISIGKNKYVMQIEKCNNLHEEVLKFLKDYNINLKYETPILAMVREQLTKKQQKNNQSKKGFQELTNIKQQINNKKQKFNQQQICQKLTKGQQKVNTEYQTYYSKRQNKQNYSSQYNSNSDNGASTQTPGQSYAESKVRMVQIETVNQEEARCQDVYEKWKQKQKNKQQQKMKVKAAGTTSKQNVEKSNQVNKFQGKNKQKQDKIEGKQKSKSQKKLENHTPDYFYNKGQKFKQAKQAHVEELFRERYPFQLNKDVCLTPSKKIMLHQRLFKQQQMREGEKLQIQLSSKKTQKAQRAQKTPKVNDKYKQKVIERDNKLNEALGYLIEHKMIDNPYKIQYKQKSPFRKTNC